ncbi:MAG: nicotinamidase [Balneolaceae bacterium]|nr:nicotinamidase [Balneolaceae bacterium]
MKNVLLIVDIQNDFLPGGPLAVAGGDDIIAGVNALTELEGWDSVILTQDFHPAGHSSFASAHEGKQVYDTVEMPYGTQSLWPDHCVIGTSGADFAPALNADAANVVIRKGFRKHIDSYSAFTENDGVTSTGLAGTLKDIGGGDPSAVRVFVVGLATDFCAGYSAADARGAGFEVVAVRDLMRGIDMNGSVDAMWARLRDAGVEIVESCDVAGMIS